MALGGVPGQPGSGPAARPVVRYQGPHRLDASGQAGAEAELPQCRRTPSTQDRVGKRIATALTGGTGSAPTRQLCFDASDTMPPTLRDAFQHAVLQFLSASHRSLADAPLGQLEEERKRLLRGTDWLPSSNICGNPAG